MTKTRVTRVNFTILGWKSKDISSIRNKLSELGIKGINFDSGELVDRKITQFDSNSSTTYEVQNCREIGIISDGTVYGERDYVSTVKSK